MEKIVYHKSYGFGKVEVDNLDATEFNVNFNNKIIEMSYNKGLKDNSYLIALDDKFEKFIKENKYKFLFTPSTINRSKTVKIHDLAFASHTSLSCKAKPSSSSSPYSYESNYSITISFNNGSLKTKCTCPVGTLCKHSFRLLEEISKLFYDEKQYYIASLASYFSNYVFSHKVEEIYENFILLNIKDGIEKRIKEEDIIPLCEYMLDKKMDKEQEILYFYVESLNNQELLYKYMSLLPSNFNYLFSRCRLGSFNTTPKEEYLDILSLFMQKKYDEVFDYISNKSKIYDYNVKYFLNRLMPLVTLDEERIKKMVHVICTYFDRYTYTPNIDFLIPHLTISQLLKIKGVLPKIDVDLSKFSYEELLDNLHLLGDKDILDFIKNNFEKAKKDSLQIIEIIFGKLREYSYDSALYDCLSMFEESKYYALLFLCYCSSKQFVKKHVQDAINKTKEINLECLKDKFDYEVYDVTNNCEKTYTEFSSEPQVELSHRLYIKGQKMIALTFFTELSLNLGRKSNLITSYFETIEKNCLEATKEQEQKLIEEERQNMITQINRIKKNSLRDYLRDFSYSKDGMLLKDIKSAKKFYFEIRFDISQEINLYIGEDKIYKIKNIKYFFNAYRSRSDYEINKKVKIDFSKDYFEPHSQKIFDIAYKNHTEVGDSYYHENEFVLNDEGIEELIKLENGVYFEKTFFPVDEEKELHFSVDENKIIHVEPDISNLSVFYGKKKLYLINKNDRVLNEIKNGKEIQDLIPFFKRFNGISIENNEDYFNKALYRGNEKYIDLSSNISFSQQDEEIELYFDLEDDIINYRIAIKKDNKYLDSVSEASYSTINDLSTIKKMLTELNFEDDAIKNDEDIYNFLTSDLTVFKKICKLFLSEKIKNKKFVSFPKQNLRVDYGNSMINAFWADSTFSEEELEKVYNAIKKKKKFVQLKGNRIIEIDNEEAKEFYEVSSSLHLNSKKLGTSQKSNFYNAFKAVNYIDDEDVKAYFTKVIEEISDYKTNKINKEVVDATLKDYQVDGINWLNTLSKHNLGGILADDMGLGKTLQTIALINNNPSTLPSLIVCPKSLIFNWFNEFQKFSPKSNVIKVYGSQDERKLHIDSMSSSEGNIYITSYDSLRNDIEHYKNLKFNYLVLDEAQAIKTYSSKKAITVKQLDANHKFALTGTPIENTILELWSIFDFLMPGYLDDISVFKKQFENNEDYQKKISKIVSMFVLRRTKQEVLKELPPKTERVIEAEMTQEQRKVYDAVCKNAKEMLENSAGIFDVLPFLMRLRQICVDPHMFVDNYEGESGKTTLITSTIEDLISKGHKILIFSQFVKALNIYEQIFERKNIDYYILTGETKAEDRLKLCNQFNTDKTPVFLISLKAGGNGLNLVGADTVIHIDPWWNSAVQDQATDRAYRIGQTKNVDVIKFICQESIEERVIELQNKKKDLIDSLIKSSDESLSKLSKDDIKFLLD